MSYFYRFGENKGSYCTLASFNDKENVLEVSEEVKDLIEEELKDEIPKEKVESPVSFEPIAKVDVKDEKKDESAAASVKESKSKVWNKQIIKVHVFLFSSLLRGGRGNGPQGDLKMLHSN